MFLLATVVNFWHLMRSDDARRRVFVSQLADDYREMLRIRRFEETVLASFSRGMFFGTTHTYLGQEAIAVGVLHHVTVDDIVVSNHRCHGHFLAYGGPMHALAAELMGRTTGVCGGRGGSQHVKWKSFFSSGILGGTIPLGTGMAFARKVKGKGMVFTFLGDGAFGEGVVYETLNMASLWGLPILFIVENNQYAQTTPIGQHMVGGLRERFAAFSIDAEQVDGSNLQQVRRVSGQLTKSIRKTSRPAALICSTYRFGPHSKGDDLRDPEEIDRHRKNDPLQLVRTKLPHELVNTLEEEIDEEVQRAFRQAEADPLADPAALTPPLERTL